MRQRSRSFWICKKPTPFFQILTFAPSMTFKEMKESNMLKRFGTHSKRRYFKLLLKFYIELNQIRFDHSFVNISVGLSQCLPRSRWVWRTYVGLRTLEFPCRYRWRKFTTAPRRTLKSLARSSVNRAEAQAERVEKLASWSPLWPLFYLSTC